MNYTTAGGFVVATNITSSGTLTAANLATSGTLNATGNMSTSGTLTSQGNLTAYGTAYLQGGLIIGYSPSNVIINNISGNITSGGVITCTGQINAGSGYINGGVLITGTFNTYGTVGMGYYRIPIIIRAAFVSGSSGSSITTGINAGGPATSFKVYMANAQASSSEYGGSVQVKLLTKGTGGNHMGGIYMIYLCVLPSGVQYTLNNFSPVNSSQITMTASASTDGGGAYFNFFASVSCYVSTSWSMAC